MLSRCLAPLLILPLVGCVFSSGGLDTGGGTTTGSTGGGGATSNANTGAGAGGEAPTTGAGGTDAGPMLDAGPVVDAGPIAPGPGTALQTSIGSKSYLRIPNLTVPHDFTMELWLVVDDATVDNQILLSKDKKNASTNQFRIGLVKGQPFLMMTDGSSGGNLWSASANNYAIIGPALVKGVWRHLAVTKSGKSFALYVDGAAPVNFTASADLSHSGAQTFEIASRLDDDNSSPDSIFGGTIDEVRIWDMARSEAEIAADRGNTIWPSHPQYTHLVAYYRLDDGSGTVALDQKGTYPGTLVNNPKWVTSAAPTGN